MNEELADEVRSAVETILRDHAGSAAGGFDSRLWQELTATGFHLIGVPEKFGGSGGALREAAAVIDVAAFHAAAVPLVETALLAGWLVERAGLPMPEGMTTVSLDTTDLRGTRVSGRLRVPWGRHADHVVALTGDGTAVVTAVASAHVEPAENLAGEPRDILVFDDAPVLFAASAGVDAEELQLRGALGRSVQMAGAAGAVLESARRHVADRVQFGRPLARFQAVQQHLAALAAEVTAMRVGADAAVLAAAAGDAPLAVAAAKATTSAGAAVVAAIGHQLHGALGYSAEHRLGAVTTRLWSWREEFGNESYWQDRLGAAVVRHGAWWPVVTGDSR
jgi:acyl-CoA dehydrogenase